ncbi:MAG: mannonate dehydratase [Oscillospiraceae bacterium]|nr:mannonate dehydratase [Oscillospiraceae bacterium]
MSDIKIQQGISSTDPDERLQFISQQGIRYVYAIMSDDDANYDGIMKLKDRLSRYNLILSDLSNTKIYKNPSIHLGFSDRDEHIDRYNMLTRAIAKAGIGINYMTWEPNQVLSSRFTVGTHTRGAKGRIVDINELKTLPFSHRKQFTEEETWDNFKYFLDRALPVCEEVGVKIALHPCDPPVPSLLGIYNLIHCSDDYRRAFELVSDNEFLGMKMCIGCWLEGGPAFGDLLSDIQEFVSNGKVLIVHFRNVSATHPFFEETLIEDGYMNMYEVMKTLVECSYDGYLTVDHVPTFTESYGGKDAAFAYANGYAKALLNAAEYELGR